MRVQSAEEVVRALMGAELKPRVGFESQSPAGDGTEVVFSEIHYSSKKIADIYNSEAF